MSVPEKIRQDIKERLWAQADRLNWSALSSADKSRYYTIWTETEDVGGLLAAYMDARQVRVYIKDTLLKAYTRETSANPELAFRVLNISSDVPTMKIYIKPHGRLLADDRQIAWSKASDWKATLMALHERSFEAGRPYAAIFSNSAFKFATNKDREVVESAAKKLGVEYVIWVD